MPRRTKEEAEQTKEAVLQSALDLFYEKGYSRTTFDEIAKRIGLTKGAAYWHFRNKADLLAELMNIKFKQKQNLAKIQSEKILTVEALRNSVIADAQIVQNDPDYCKFLFFILYQMEWSEAIIQKISGQIREIRDFPFFQLKEILTLLQKNGEIASNVDIDETVIILLCLWRGVLNVYISKTYPMDLVRTLTKSFDLIMDGIKVEKKEKCK